MTQLDHFDRALLHYLIMSGGSASAGRMSEHTRMSWVTAMRHLKKLKAMGYVRSKGSGRNTYWYLRDMI